MVLLDVPKGAYIFDIAGKTDYGIEQRLILWDVGFQCNMELFDINDVVVLTLFFVVFYKEIVAVVNLKAR